MVDMLIDDLGATIFRLDPYGTINWEAKNDNEDSLRKSCGHRL